MRTARQTTPIWVKLALVAAIAAGAWWWHGERQDRLGNEARLGEIASAIAGRDVRVRCPGIIGKVLTWDTVEGSVQYDEHGRPSDEAHLRVFACDELDALAEGRRAAALSCAERGETCGDELARAVDVLAHESWHLAGVADEGEAECRAVRALAWTAQRLGATPAQGRALTARYMATGYQLLPDRYRSGSCGTS
jgi:hypothetical protein